MKKLYTILSDLPDIKIYDILESMNIKIESVGFETQKHIIIIADEEDMTILNLKFGYNVIKNSNEVLGIVTKIKLWKIVFLEKINKIVS